MKTLLNIGGQTYALNDKTDAATILNALRGAVRVSAETHYGPDKDRYGKEYFSAHVQHERAETIRVELVDNQDLCSPEQWAKRCAESDARMAGNETVLSEAVG